MRSLVKPGMNAKDLQKLLKDILDSVPVDFARRVANKSLRYIDAYWQGATGRLAAFANKKDTSHRCLPGAWLTECMATRGMKPCLARRSKRACWTRMLDMDAVAADVVGRSGLGWNAEAEDEDSDVGADEEGVSDGAQQEPGGSARGVEVTDDDSKEVDKDAFASSSEESDAAKEVTAARVDRSIGRALCQIAVLEASSVAAPAKEGGVNAQGRPMRMRMQVKYSEEVQA